jgi:hypothetical protein
MVSHKFNHDIPFMKHRRNYGCKCLQMSQNVYFGKRSWFLWHNGLKFPIVMWHVIVWPFKMCMGWLLVTNIFLMWILNACVHWHVHIRIDCLSHSSWLVDHDHCFSLFFKFLMVDNHHHNNCFSLFNSCVQVVYPWACSPCLI